MTDRLKEQEELGGDDVEQQDAELLPDREALSVICPDPLTPGTAGDPALPTE
jgi:hypothetical protein